MNISWTELNFATSPVPSILVYNVAQCDHIVEDKWQLLVTSKCSSDPWIKTSIRWSLQLTLCLKFQWELVTLWRQAFLLLLLFFCNMKIFALVITSCWTALPGVKFCSHIGLICPCLITMGTLNTCLHICSRTPPYVSISVATRYWRLQIYGMKHF